MNEMTMTKTMTDTTIRKQIFLPAPKAVVWDYLTKAERLNDWFHPAEADLAEGQDYLLTSGKDGERMCWGKVVEMRPHDYLRWEFTVGPLEGKMTTVEWLIEESSGGSRLTLTHSGLPESVEGFGLVLALDKGWHGFLMNLRDLASMQADGSYSATINVPAPVTAAWRAIRDEMHLWWSLQVEPSETGATIRFGNSHVSFDIGAERDGIEQWLCTDANMIIEDVADTAEWQGTSLIWRVVPEGSGSRITLTHQGLNQSLECLDVCTRGWQHFFEGSLKAHLSGGMPSPETN